MPAADATGLFDPAALERLFAPFLGHSAVLLAVSGGPDSTALMLLAARWRAARADGPALHVATIDHGLRAASAEEALSVARACHGLGLPHATLAWTGDKPARGIQEAARTARYGLLREHAGVIGAGALALAHTLDDQAETVLFRLARGSGLSGLAAMRSVSQAAGLVLLRPFLDIPKAGLISALEAAGAAYISDPSNEDPRFTRPRLRKLAPALAAEGLDAPRFAVLAQRMARAEAALAQIATQAAAQCTLGRTAQLVRFDAGALLALPQEISLRILMSTCADFASEGAVELAKAERLHAALMAVPSDAALGQGRVTRTLAGALVMLDKGEIVVRRAPERGRKISQSRQIQSDGASRPWQARARHLD